MYQKLARIAILEFHDDFLIDQYPVYRLLVVVAYGNELQSVLVLDVVPRAEVMEQGSAEGPPIADTASLREAYAQMLWSRREAIPVERDGVIVGRVTRAACEQEASRHP